MCSNGKDIHDNTMPTSWIEPETLTLTVRCNNHQAIADHNSNCVKLIQQEIGKLSPKTLQMEEVGKFFLKKISETISSVLKCTDFQIHIFRS
jgi:hypothetical protein